MRILLIPFFFGAWNAQAQDHTTPTFPRGPVYGRHCGIVGEDPLPRNRLETLVLFKDSVGVLDLLNDTSLVMRAYGAEGVIRLQRQGVPFGSNVLTRVAELRSSKTEIRTCSGCSYGFDPPYRALQDNVSYNTIR